VLAAIYALSILAAGPTEAQITSDGQIVPALPSQNIGSFDPTDLIVGGTAPGTLIIGPGGTVENTGGASITNSAAASPSSVTVTGQKATWTNTGAVLVGESSSGGLGILNIEGGGMVQSTNFKVGDLSNGTATVSGTGSKLNLTGNLLEVGKGPPGSNALGILDITNGGQVNVLGNSTVLRRIKQRHEERRRDDGERYRFTIEYRRWR
jgi:T5SS/PEP-CTERM-associated repeat protein